MNQPTLLAFACVLLLQSLSAATMYYVPSEEPFLWTDERWFSDSAATTPTNFPGVDDTARLEGSVLQNKTMTVPSGASPAVDNFQLRQPGMTLEIADGASLTAMHTTTIGKANNACLHVLKGGTFTSESIFHISSGNYKNVRLLIDEGGSASFANNIVSVGNSKKVDAFLENHGDCYFSSTTRIGYYDGAVATDTVTGRGFLDNYGTLRTRSTGSNYLQIGAQLGCIGYFTNRVDATANLNMTMLVGAGTNGTGYVVNDGTMTQSRNLCLGGDSVTSAVDDITSEPAANGTLLNNGTLSVSGKFTIGGHRYGSGTFENYGPFTVGSSAVLADRQHTKARVSMHSTSTTTFNDKLTLGYYGDAKLSIGGAAYVTNNIISLAEKSGSVGTLNLTSNGRLYGNRKGLNIVASTGSATGSVNLSGASKYDKPGEVKIGAGTQSKASLTLTDSSKLYSPYAIIVGIGSTNQMTVGQSAKLTLSGTSTVDDVRGSLFVATNVYGRGEVEIADSASFVFSPTSSRKIYLAHNSQTAEAWLRMRGGSITMTTNGIIYIGRNSTKVSACNGYFTGWGKIERHSPNLTGSAYGITLNMPCGAVIADGEGQDRDLDLSFIRKINSNGMNLSGSNGWYAVRGGRLTYPCRFSGYRMLGDYYSREGNPVYVNGVSVDCAGGVSSNRLIGQLYATDRTDIPEGLVADDAENGCLRLGVWRATINDNYNLSTVSTETRGTFSSAEIKVRYDANRVREFCDGYVGAKEHLRIVFRSHNGTATGRWRRVASRPLSEADGDGYLIGGKVNPSPEAWNLGFFSVSIEPVSGFALIVK